MAGLVSLSVAFAAVLFIKLAMATDHTVGSPNGGWDESTNLQKWSDAQNFLPGDKLVFKYAPSHDVVEVSKADYAACSSSNAILSDNSGATTIKLTKPGTRYFICGIPGHCDSGMKLQVNVLATATPSLATSPSVSPVAQPGGPSDALAPFGSPTASAAGGPALSLPPATPSSAGRSGVFQPLLGLLFGAVVLAYAF